MPDWPQKGGLELNWPEEDAPGPGWRAAQFSPAHLPPAHWTDLMPDQAPNQTAAARLLPARFAQRRFQLKARRLLGPAAL
ncbi:hypothetical protein GCM10009077_34060 [Roseibium denhamense]